METTTWTTGRLPVRIEGKISPEPTSGCWLWTAAVLPDGYAALWNGRRMAKAHRVIYELLRGPVPVGLDLDHLCRVRCCVNPDHLEPVTRRENIRRGVGPVAAHMAKTHCIYGHPFSGSNLIVYSSKPHHRRCRICTARHGRNYYLSARASGKR